MELGYTTLPVWMCSPTWKLSEPVLLGCFWRLLYMKVKVKSLSRDRLFVTPWTVPARHLRPWDFPGKSTGVGCHFLLQGIFPTQGSNPGLLHCRQTLPSEPEGSSSLHRHDQLTPFSASLPSLQKRGDGADKLLIMALSFLVLPQRTKRALRTLIN